MIFNVVLLFIRTKLKDLSLTHNIFWWNKHYEQFAHARLLPLFIIIIIIISIFFFFFFSSSSSSSLQFSSSIVIQMGIFGTVISLNPVVVTAVFIILLAFLLCFEKLLQTCEKLSGNTYKTYHNLNTFLQMKLFRKVWIR